MLQVFCIAWEYKFFVILPVAEMPTSGDLKSGNFFGPASPPPTEFANTTPPKISYLFLPLTPPPHLTKQFRGKNVDLSVSDFNWLNTHPIRLSII